MRPILPDASNTSPLRCPRCGTQNSPGTTYCPVCGHDPSSAQAQVPPLSAGPFSASGPASITPHTSTSLASPASVATSNTAKSLREYFGWGAVDGTVIHVGPSQLVKAPIHLWKLLVKLVVGVAAVFAFGTLALMIIVSLFAFSVVLSWLFPSYRRGSGGFLQNIASQVVSFFLISRLLGQRPTVNACDYRLRDTSGNEHIVRVEGYIYTGGMNIGDDVVAEGYDRRGTLVMKQGWNKRLGTLIRVKER